MLEQKSDSLYELNLRLQKQNDQMVEALQFVQGQLQVQKDKRILIELRTAKLRKANKVPVRDYVTFQDFNDIIQQQKLNTGSYPATRRKCAIILLYITGPFGITNL